MEMEIEEKKIPKRKRREKIPGGGLNSNKKPKLVEEINMEIEKKLKPKALKISFKSIDLVYFPDLM
jgi:hypothetical protein